MIAEFPARQWKQRTLFDLVRRTDSTAVLPGCLVAVVNVRWELIQTLSWLM